MRGRRIAALTAVLLAPSFASARALEPPPVAEFDDSPSDAPAEGPSDVPADVINPDLAAAAPQSDWIREGYGEGDGVATDPRALNRKIRRAGRVTLAGGGIAILGGAVAITGAILLYGVRPASRLKALRDDNMGVLPVDDDQRHRLINIARAGPIVAFTGLGVMVGGVITAAIARLRLKKLREQRRTSIVSFAPTPYGRGAEIHWEVKF